MTVPQFKDVIEAAARLQEVVPDAVLVGGTAAAHHEGHRASSNDDHVLSDLRERFSEVLEALEEGWVTSVDGIETGIRQLVRRKPLEVEEVRVGRRKLRVPTTAEIFRIKCWLVLRRNATRDYLDVVALAERLGSEASRVALSLDDYYADQVGPGGSRVATQLAKQLADPRPYDLSDVELEHYHRLEPRWRHWDRVAEAARTLAIDVLDEASRKE